jgi:3-hydroxyisobutyrate dehydrogenase-like beta-hydroxyacid dehydrogenase
MSAEGDTATPRAGVLGLGVMGAPMAANILAAGFPLTVSSRSHGPVAALAQAGAQVANSPAEVASLADVLVVMVPDTSDMASALEGPTGILAGAHQGLVVVAMGTHEPSAMPVFAAQLAEHGAAFLDAPVSGGDIGARDGTLSIMVGGEVAALERAMPVLRAVGRTITHIGPSGAGQIAKACNQLVVGSNIQALAEAFTLARASGVDPGRVLAALAGGLAGSVVLDRYSRRMLERDFVPGGRAALHARDARIVLAAAERAGVRLPGFEPVAAAFAELVARGGGDLDHSALVTLFDHPSTEPAS